MSFGKSTFKLDIAAPNRRQEGESVKHHQLYLRWKTAGYPEYEQLAIAEKANKDTIKRYANRYEWKKRRDLNLLRESTPLTERIHKPSKEPAKHAMDSTGLLPPPPPLPRGLHKFAIENAHVVCPGFEIDAIVDVMLAEFEAIIEGPAHQRMLITPHPRAGKTNVAIIALVYSLLRQPDRGQALISANGRLSAISNQMMRTLFEHAVPEGYGISKDSKSKLAWKPSWQNAKEQLALSRDAALLGYTISGLIVADDIAGAVSDIESENTMESVMRTLNTDVMTRLTKDASGKGGSIVIIGQRLGPGDPTGRMIDAAKLRERNGEHVVPYTVVATPFLNPTLEEQARIVSDFPDSWHVKFPRFGRVGQPVSSRFTKEFAQDIESTMSPKDFNAMYRLQCSHQDTYCSWRRSYLQPIATEDITCKGSFIALDMNLSGEKGADTSALVAVGAQDNRAVVLGVHELHGHVEDALPQILEYADKYNCHTLGVEKAAGGFFVLRSLQNNVAGRTFNVVALSHEGRSKKNRQAKILGLASQGKVLIREDIPLFNVIHDQQRSIALDRKRDRDDYADALNYGVDWVNTHWLCSGFTPGDVRWEGGSNGTPGATPVVWGRGTSAGFTRPSIDGGQYFQPWQ